MASIEVRGFNHTGFTVASLDRAIPFFCDPNHDTVIECLPSCCSPANRAKYPPIRFGDYAAWFAGKSYEHLASRPGPDDAAIAPGDRATRRW